MQAEDGIRVKLVTGVHTCALPISGSRKWALGRGASETWRRFREGWAALPSGNAARWGMTVVVGFLLACLLKIGRASCRERVSILVVSGSTVEIRHAQTSLPG